MHILFYLYDVLGLYSELGLYFISASMSQRMLLQLRMEVPTALTTFDHVAPSAT